LVFEADQQLTYSAVSNLIHNALKYTHAGGIVQVRGNLVGEHIVVEEATDNLGPEPGQGLLYA